MATKTINVRSTTRKDGTHVEAHQRTIEVPDHVTTAVIDLLKESKGEIFERYESVVDSRLSEIHGDLDDERRKGRQIMDRIHYDMGDRQHYRGKVKYWGMTDEEALEQLEDSIDQAEYDSPDEHIIQKQVKLLSEWNENEFTQDRLRDDIDVLQNEYAQSPWTRFFLVQNNNGHIHKNMSCSKCYPTTQYGWLPSLSGLSTEDAVDSYGSMLCSTCYPDAPTDWVDGSKEGTVQKQERFEKRFEKESAKLPEVKKAEKAASKVRNIDYEISRAQSTMDVVKTYFPEGPTEGRESLYENAVNEAAEAAIELKEAEAKKSGLVTAAEKLQKLADEATDTLRKKIEAEMAAEDKDGPKDETCPGSGKYINRDLPYKTKLYRGNYGTCESCGKRVGITPNDKIRKHKAE